MVEIEIPVVYAMHDGQDLKHPLVSNKRKMNWSEFQLSIKFSFLRIQNTYNLITSHRSWIETKMLKLCVSVKLVGIFR